MADIIQLRRDTETGWNNNNPVLAQGEVGIELGTNKFKIGDGVSVWTGLPYFSSGSGSSSDLPMDLADVFTNTFQIPAYNTRPEFAYKGEYSHIMFTLNCSKLEMTKGRYDNFFCIKRYKINKQSKLKRQRNIRYKIMDDHRHQTDIKLYCWAVNVDDSSLVTTKQPVDLKYFYVDEEYADLSALIAANPIIYLSGNIYTQKSTSAQVIANLFQKSNYATCFNNVSTGLYQKHVSDLNIGSNPCARYPQFDINSFADFTYRKSTQYERHAATLYFDKVKCKLFRKNGHDYYFWTNRWSVDNNFLYYLQDTDGNPVPDIIPTDLPALTQGTLQVHDISEGYSFIEDRRDLNWYKKKDDNRSKQDVVDDIFWDTNDRIDEISTIDTSYLSWIVYQFDYPVMPVRLSDCEVLVTEKLPSLTPGQQDNPGWKPGSWVKFDTLLNDTYGIQQWGLMREPVFRIPYDTAYLFMRFCGWQKACFFTRRGRNAYGTQQRTGVSVKNNLLKAAVGSETYSGSILLGHRRTGRKILYSTNSGNTEWENVEFVMVSQKELSYGFRSNTKSIYKKLILNKSNRCHTALQ